MRAEIIRIGNSKGLRIPKTVLEQCGMKTTIDLGVQDHSLIVTPTSRMGDTLLDKDSLSNCWDEDEWQW